MSEVKIKSREEVWDENSERIDTDIDSLQEFAGTDVMKKYKFLSAIKEREKALLEEMAKEIKTITLLEDDEKIDSILKEFIEKNCK